MATWGDLADSGVTWGDLSESGVTWGDLPKLSAEELQSIAFFAIVALAALSKSELADFEAGVQDGSLAPKAVASIPPESSGVRSVARSIWEKVRPRNRSELIAYAGLLVSLAQLLQGVAPADERPVEVHVEVTTPASPSPTPTPTREVHVEPIRLAPPAEGDGTPRGVRDDEGPALSSGGAGPSRSSDEAAGAEALSGPKLPSE